MSPIQRITNKLRLLVTRGLALVVRDEVQRQLLQVRVVTGDTLDNVPRWQNYGHTSVPPKSSDVLLALLNGSASSPVAICVEDPEVRLKDLKSGDSALYHLEGHYFKVTENGVMEGVGTELNIRVKRVNIIAEEECFIDSPKTKLTGDLDVTGTVTGKEGLFSGISSTQHTHNETGSVTHKPNGGS
ncbi:phage baseplate assembly protein V [Vibrio sp. LaRot3]|uniref:phage baseplate assembly protein V n=1 Tax=Vibrio sp. LaRot3 TaxID=2998829 RepID=UPI0022CE1E20|nr:phage baseplate assembly protein V [Vibrio sp. LaRot3]MDA0148861.1 phage baseplate assembly protein V [Vibrio sp. LaRot3]